jgi:hypothetical protein
MEPKNQTPKEWAEYETEIKEFERETERGIFKISGCMVLILLHVLFILILIFCKTKVL